MQTRTHINLTPLQELVLKMVADTYPKKSCSAR